MELGLNNKKFGLYCIFDNLSSKAVSKKYSYLM